MYQFKVGDTVALRGDPSVPYAVIVAFHNEGSSMELKSVSKSPFRFYRDGQGRYNRDGTINSIDVIPYIEPAASNNAFILGLRVGDKVALIGTPHVHHATVIGEVEKANGRRQYVLEKPNGTLTFRYLDGASREDGTVSTSSIMPMEPLPEKHAVDVVIWRYEDEERVRVGQVDAAVERWLKEATTRAATKVIELGRSQVTYEVPATK